MKNVIINVCFVFYALCVPVFVYCFVGLFFSLFSFSSFSEQFVTAVLKAATQIMLASSFDRTNTEFPILLYRSDLKMGGEAVFHFGSKHSSLVDISVIASCLPTIPCSNCVGSGLSHRFIGVETGRRVAQTHSKAPITLPHPLRPP